jgi:MHS family alpha-ketoglutarate permease-like MFS transporter
MLLTAGGTLAFYAYSTYMQKFLVNTSGFSREAATRSPRRRCSSSC